MNIVVLSHRVPFPPNKGEKIRTFHQLEYLREQGCDVTVFCPVANADEKALAEKYSETCGIRVIAVPCGARKLAMLKGLVCRKSLTVANFYEKDLQRAVDSHLESQVVDAVYCTSSAMMEYVFKSGQAILNTPGLHVLVDFMDLDSDKWRQYSEISRFPMSLIYRYEQTVLSAYEADIQASADFCIFISPNEVELFSQKLANAGENLRVVGNGVDLDAFRPRAHGNESADNVMLFSGVMDYMPNVNAMQWFVDRIWPELRTSHPDARLVIAGMNPSPAVVEMGNDTNIEVTGYVDDMLACYHRARLFVAPFQIARGVQNKILQAFACGLPVVTSTSGAEGIDCNHEEHCLIADSPAEFLDCIERLLADPDLYGRLSVNGLQLVNDQYTWAANNRKLFQLFETASVQGKSSDLPCV